MLEKSRAPDVQDLLATTSRFEDGDGQSQCPASARALIRAHAKPFLNKATGMPDGAHPH